MLPITFRSIGKKSLFFYPDIVQSVKIFKNYNAQLRKCLQVPVMKGGKVNSNVDMTMGPVDVDFDGMSSLHKIDI
jgi:hypothetical protein